MSGKRYPEEFKTEAVKQVVDRGYSVASVATRLDITTHSLYAWIKKYGPDSSTNKEQSDAQAEIRRLQKELKRVTDERDILKKAALDVRLPEQFSIIGKLRARYPVATLCHVFGVHRSSYKYWKNRPEKPDGLYYAARYLNCMASATALPEQEASPQWQPREATRWGAGLLADS